MKKIILILSIISVMFVSLTPKTEAAYIPGKNLNFGNMALEIPYIDENTAKVYLIVSNNLYYNIGSSSAFVYSDEFEQEAPHGAVINYDYTSGDFVIQNDTITENFLITWFGGSEGLFLLGQVVILELWGGWDLPEYNPTLAYTFSNNNGTISIYDGTIWYNTYPQTNINRILTGQLSGYNQGVLETTPSIDEAYNLGYNQALAETTQNYEYVLKDIYEITIPSRERTSYDQGKRDGYVLGYDVGISQNVVDSVNFNWIQTIFLGIGSFLAIELFGGISIGMIVGIPLVFGLVFFILKLVRG